MSEKIKRVLGFKSIRAKVLVAMLLMLCIAVGFIWVMQIVRLDVYYEQAKTEAVQDVADSIEREIDSGDIKSVIMHIERSAFENKLCVQLIPLDRENKDYPGEILVDSLGRDCPVHGWSTSQELLTRIVTSFAMSGE